MASEVETQRDAGETESERVAHAAGAERMRRGRLAMHLLRQGAIVVVLLVVVAGLYIYWDRADHAPAATQAAGPQGPMPVGVVTVEPQIIPLSSQFLGQTVASQVVPIRARISGYLVERAFEEGQQVEEGQLLFRIDPQPFEVALNQAQAQLAAAQARLERAEQQLARFQALAEQQSAAASELEQWQEEQQVAAAEVQLQQARVEQAQLDLDYTTIESPIDGVIGQTEQDVGSYISPTGNALLATVRKVDPIYVRFSMSEQDLLRMQRLVSSGAVTNVPIEELTVQVILPDDEPYAYVGEINYVDVTIDPSTGTAVVRATVPNPDHTLLPGQYVQVRVSGMERLDAVLVPQGAVMQNPTGSTVYVVDDAGTAQIRPVVVGEWYGDAWVIDSGLEAGDRVVVDHLMQVRPGAPIDPQPVAMPTPTPTTQPSPADNP